MEEDWSIEFNLFNFEEICYRELETKVESIHEHVIIIIENGFRAGKYNFIGNVAKNHDDELTTLMDRNKQLRHDIDIKLKEFTQQKNLYENYKNDQKLLSREIKETHEAFLMAKKFYKKFLKLYYTIESKSGGNQLIFVQFFTEVKKESEKYSMRLLRDTRTGCYQLTNVTPKLPIFKELQQLLQDTNDVPGGLFCIRQAFINIKMNKK